MLTLRLILGDQLNPRHPWFEEVRSDVLYVMMECRSETDYARHHIQKVLGFFGAMRRFAAGLQQQGHRVVYLKLDDPENRQSISGNIRDLTASYAATRFEYQLPDEFRLDQELKELGNLLNISVKAVDSAHFLTDREELARHFRGKKTYIMESFYRAMRIRTGLLMEADGKTPMGERWNFDVENRKKLPAKVEIPEPLVFAHDLTGIAEMIRAQGVNTMGHADPGRFSWPLDRSESLQLLAHFLNFRLPLFGTYQDAMTLRDTWLFHSRLSFSLNLKMISPKEVAEAAVLHWKAHPERISLAQVEGFIRQIIGWREYMRGIYWAQMPGYAALNYFNHQAALPSWYWTGETRMRCLRHAIGQSLEEAYAHHIQRLMLTGNFALLLGVHPDEVDRWYLGIYMDAVEWVEITNTRGMSQFADGGVVGTKPYVSSANYIRNMSDYCSGCAYDPGKRYGPGACPFNSLYWDFYDRQAQKLSSNPRIGMMYRTWEKMPAEERARILEQAAFYKAHAEHL